MEQTQLLRRFTLYMSLAAAAITVGYGRYNESPASMTVLAVLTILPFLFYGLSLLTVLRKRRDTGMLSVLGMVFASIAMIAGADGQVEYHFSVFVVMAIATWTQRASIVAAAAGLFTIQHGLGLIWFPEWVFGSHHYGLRMVLIHAAFLIAAAAAGILNIRYTERAARRQAEEIERRQSLALETSGRLRESTRELVLFAGGLSESTKHIEEANVSNAAAIASVQEGTGRQASLTTESAKAVEEIAAGIAQIADLSHHVSDAAQRMLRQAEGGGESLRRVREQYGQIRESNDEVEHAVIQLSEASEEVQVITNVIGELSAQTDLLALNAAIEAARAGEHGRGFAVVAGEVRKLATRSAESARHITELVGKIKSAADSVSHLTGASAEVVRRSQAVVTDAGAAFDVIMAQSRDVAGEVQEVSAESAGLAAAAGQVTVLLEQVSQTAAASAEEMKRLAVSSSRTKLQAASIAQSITEMERLASELHQLSEALVEERDALPQAGGTS